MGIPNGGAQDEEGDGLQDADTDAVENLEHLAVVVLDEAVQRLLIPYKRRGRIILQQRQAEQRKNRMLCPGYPIYQWSALLSMLNSHNKNHEKLTGNTSSIHCIVDTGASHHMTGDATLLTNVCDVAPSLVGLPNGSTTMAVKTGAVALEKK